MKDDTVSRQAAIDALDGLCDRECEYSKKQRHTMCGACHLGSAFDVIEQLPLSRENLVNNSNHIVNYLANDTISRQTAIDAIRTKYCPSDFMDDGVIDAFAEIIQDLPSAQPERKTGKWIDYIGKDLGVDGQWLRDDGKTVFVQCDQCKSLYVRNFMNHWHWCPRCGCKMEGEQP